MNKYALHCLLLATFTGTFLFGSCGLVGDGDSKAKDTYFRAALNGEKTWVGDEMRATFSERKKSDQWRTIIADTLHKQHYPYTERLVIVAIFEGVGTYPLTEIEHELDETGSAYYEKDGDVLISSYHPTEDASANQLTITSYDSTAGILKEPSARPSWLTAPNACLSRASRPVVVPIHFGLSMGSSG